MSWSITLLQTCILIVFSYLAVQFFTHNTVDDIHYRLDELSTQLAGLEQKVDQLDAADKALVQQRRSQNVVFQGDNTRSLEQLRAVTERLQALESLERKIENKVILLSEQAQDNKQIIPDPPRPRPPVGWMSTLSEEKRIQVQQVFQERLAAMQTAIGTSPGDVPPSAEEVRTVLEDSRQDVKDQLAEILSNEEYDAFVKTLEQAEHPPDVSVSGSQE